MFVLTEPDGIRNMYSRTPADRASGYAHMLGQASADAANGTYPRTTLFGPDFSTIGLLAPTAPGNGSTARWGTCRLSLTNAMPRAARRPVGTWNPGPDGRAKLDPKSMAAAAPTTPTCTSASGGRTDRGRSRRARLAGCELAR